MLYDYNITMTSLFSSSSMADLCMIYIILVDYSALDNSGSVKNLTKRVSLKQKFGHTKLHLLFNK